MMISTHGGRIARVQPDQSSRDDAVAYARDSLWRSPYRPPPHDARASCLIATQHLRRRPAVASAVAVAGRNPRPEGCPFVVAVPSWFALPGMTRAVPRRRRARGRTTRARHLPSARGTRTCPPHLEARTPGRAVKDPLAAAIMAPRVALGGLDLLSKGELFAVAAEEAGELSALLSDPRPIQDKAAEAFRRAETVVEMFEARGVVAEAPGRELVRPAIPADLYDKYLDPAAIEPAPATPSASANAYTAEPASYASAATTTREVEIPESEAFTAVHRRFRVSHVRATTPRTPPSPPPPPPSRRRLRDRRDEARARAVRWIRKRVGLREGADAAEEVEAPAAARASTSDAARRRRLTPAPSRTPGAGEEAESLAAEFVMGQSAAIATKEAR